MSINTVVRDGMANGFKQLFRVQGKTITYTDEEGTSATLYADSKPGERVDGDVLGMPSETSTRTFSIPRQTGFPPTNGVHMNHLIVLNGVRYLVRQAPDDADGLLAVHDVLAVRDQAVTGL